jgi:outer membrane protein assembly factor BamA
MIPCSCALCGVGILLASLVALPGRAVGQTARYAGWRVAKVEVTGVPSDLRAPFPAGLALAVRSGLLRRGRAEFRPDDLTADRDRFRLWLARNGLPYAGVETRVTPVEGRESLKIEFAVTPGPMVAVTTVSVQGIPESTPRLERAIHKALPPGSRFTDEGIRVLAAEARTALERAGYARANVDARVTRPDSVSAAVEFVATPGPVFTIDSVRVVGAPEDLAPLVKRTLAIRPGQPYSPRVVEKARDDLRRLSLFRQVRVFTEESATGDGTGLVLVAFVGVGTHRSALFGVGSWSDDPWRFSALWRHRNLFRGGRGFQANGIYSRYLRELGALTWWPALLTARSRLELDGRFQIEDEDAYEERELRAELANTFRPSFETTYRIGLAWSDVQVEVRSPDADIGDTEPGVLWSVLGQWRYDGANDLLSPSTGNRLSVVTEYSPEGPLSETPFYLADASAIRYLPIRARSVLALRIAGGIAEPLGDSRELLPSRRFFAGGVNTMRGYARRRLGPRDSANQPIGGETRVLLNAESRFPLYRSFRGAAFVDAGQVWSRPADTSLGDLQVAVGAGLVFTTPVGPIRLDTAYLLTTPIGGDSRTQFHFAIGNPF